MKELVEKLAVEFDDKDYAHAYMQEHTIDRIAAQIYALRQQRGWSQEELAKMAGISQERVSKLEGGDFDSLTLKTLWKFTEAFDAHLHVSIIPFSKGIMDVVNLHPDKLKVTPRKQDILQMRDKCLVEIPKGKWQSVPENKFTAMYNSKVDSTIKSTTARSKSIDAPTSRPLDKEWHDVHSPLEAMA